MAMNIQKYFDTKRIFKNIQTQKRYNFGYLTLISIKHMLIMIFVSKNGFLNKYLIFTWISKKKIQISIFFDLFFVIDVQNVDIYPRY